MAVCNATCVPNVPAPTTVTFCIPENPCVVINRVLDDVNDEEDDDNDDGNAAAAPVAVIDFERVLIA